MGLSKYYIQEFKLFTKVRTNQQGVVKEELILEDTFMGRLDKAPSSYNFSHDRENYNITNILFTNVNNAIVEDTIIQYDNNDYDVVSVINPFYKGDHMEIHLSRIK